MLFLRQKGLSVSKKRHADDFLSSDRAKIAKTYANASSPGHSGVGAYPNPQTQWPAGYGQKAQAWPQTSQAQAQAQGQQWNPAYAPQVSKLLFAVSFWEICCTVFCYQAFYVVKMKMKLT